jgi:metal transporter CNNM
LGIDSFELKRLETLGTPEDKENVKKILRVKSDHHLLITTLLLGNAMCFETLPIFMDSLMPSWMAILLSTSVILIFGEVLPQALCTGQYQIRIAVALAPVVLGFMYLFYPIGYPIARALDYFLGHAQGIEFNKDYLKTTLSIVANQGADSRLIVEIRPSSRAE